MKAQGRREIDGALAPAVNLRDESGDSHISRGCDFLDDFEEWVFKRVACRVAAYADGMFAQACGRAHFSPSGRSLVSRRFISRKRSAFCACARKILFNLGSPKKNPVLLSLLFLGVAGFLLFELAKIDDVAHEGHGVMTDLRNIARIVPFAQVRSKAVRSGCFIFSTCPDR